MNILDFLNTLENTLGSLTISGKDNVDKLMGCFLAIDRIKAEIKAQINAQQENLQDNQEEGEVDGRQIDIPTSCGTDDLHG